MATKLSMPTQGQRIMGTFKVDMSVGHIDGGDSETVSAEVDTGASHSMVPASLLEFLHVEVRDWRNFELANGESLKMGIGIASIGIQDKEWLCPVLFGPEDVYLLGATTLEAFGLVVDPENGKLIPRQYIARPI